MEAGEGGCAEVYVVVCGARPAEFQHLHQAWRHSNLTFGRRGV